MDDDGSTRAGPGAGPDLTGDWSPVPAVPALAEPAGGPHWTPATLPRPDVLDAGPHATRWAAPVSDYASPADGSSTWMAPAPAAAALPAVIEPPATRVGWLFAGRTEQGSAA